jgi:subtilisin family serine protease
MSPCTDRTLRLFRNFSDRGTRVRHNGPMPKRPRRPITNLRDHPQPIGDLAAIFERRNIGVVSDDNGNVVLARSNSIVVDPQGDRARVEEISARVAKNNETEAGRIKRDAETDGIDLVRVPVANLKPREINKQQRWSVEPVLEQLDAYRADGYRCELNHVLLGAQVFTGDPLGVPATWVGDIAFPSSTVTSGGKAALLSTAHPADEPAFWRPRLNLDDRRRPRVLVLDTGLRTLAGAGEEVEHPKLSNCKLHDEYDDDGAGVLDFEAGHGTFIAGVIRQVCPDAEVEVAGCLSSFGEGDEYSVVNAIRRGIGAGEQPPEIVVMSFGGFFANDDPGIFGDKLDDLLGDALVVAAAGNQHTCRPYFPAALPDVVAVGGLAADGKAWFTNFGGWVDACAPAVDVVSTFFQDFTEKIDGVEKRCYKGWARWSGTSFSAPKVAAAIAQEMYLNVDEATNDVISAEEAWRRLSRHDRLRYPDLGVVFNL